MDTSEASAYFTYNQISIQIFYDMPTQRMDEIAFLMDLRTRFISLHSIN
jgi:hypothetical protein